MDKPKPLPHQIPPEGEWDLWTIFGDRACGKTWAAMDLARKWATDPAACPTRGHRPSRTAIFVRDIPDALNHLVYGPAGVCQLEQDQDGMQVRVDRALSLAVFQNGAEWRFIPYSDPKRIRGWNPDNAWIEDSHLARADELEAVMGALHQEMKWGGDPRVVMTCNRLPWWECHRLAGGRNRLTVVGSVIANTTLPREFQDRLLQEQSR